MVTYKFKVDGTEKSASFLTLRQAVGALSVHVLTARAAPVSVEEDGESVPFEQLKASMVSSTIPMNRLNELWDKSTAKHQNVPSSEALAYRTDTKDCLRKRLLV